MAAFRENDRAVLAVSGGLDSMVLLACAGRYRQEGRSGPEFLVLHVNHGLRGAESDGDEALVRLEAGRWNLPFRAAPLAWAANEKSSQALCRAKRETIYAELTPGERDRVLLAHHRDDQAETIFLHLLRGCGRDGLKGMRTEQGKKIRPFLRLARAELREVAEHWRLAWREDSSNLSVKYERNWLRREIFPLLEGRRPGFAARLAALAEDFAEERAGSVRRLDSFSFGEGWRIIRHSALLGWDARALKEEFGLGREPATRLAALLQRPQGSLDARGVRIRLSCGVLLEERTGKFFGALDWAPGRAESPLGTWLFDPTHPARLAPRREYGVGDKLKKEFQASRVPIFFRDLVPVATEGKELFLPLETEAKRSGIRFIPSELGAWWLSGL
jgi:tRNA(Ile)-lysidine synthase